MSVIQLENHSSVSPLISEMGNEKYNTMESDYVTLQQSITGHFENLSSKFIRFLHFMGHYDL